ncbi:MAG: ABC transporter permease [Solirubrobacterales bacterium]
MDFLMIFSTAVRSLTMNKLRSGLTALGIIIGVASVIMMVSLSQSASAGITSRISSMGSNLLMIMPAGGRGALRGTGSSTLTRADADAIRNLPLVKNVAPEVSTSVTAAQGSLSWQSSVSGTTPEMKDIKEWIITEGSFITDADVNGMTLVAVIGPTVVENLYPSGTSPVGTTIKLNGLSFTVIGVLPSQGGASMGSDPDNMIYLPLTTVQQRLVGGSSLRIINVQAQKKEALTFLKDAITTLLRERHRLGADAEDDFRIMDMAELLSAVEDTTRILSLLLGGIAAVSLLVGGIGVMNIMLVSVTERTREIGIRMAVGATGSAIRAQFLVEAIVLCLVGGTIGTLLGCGFAYLFGMLFKEITIIVSIWSIIIAISFSMVVGLVFGYYPAKKASESDPIEALRYE